MGRNTVSLLVLACLFTGIFTGCKKESFCLKGKDPVESRTLTNTNFENIEYALAGNLYITEDTDFSITVTGPGDILDRLEITQSGNSLVIGADKCVSKDAGLDFQIHLPKLERIELSGSGNIFGLSLFHSSSPEISNSGSGFVDIGFQATESRVDLSGSGNIDLNVYGNNVQSTISGSGDLTLKGTTLSQLLSIPGSGNYFGYGIPTNNVEVITSGSGLAQVQVSGQLNVTLSGAGDVYYKGNPVIIASVSGSGQVINDN